MQEAKVGLRLPPGFDVDAFVAEAREWAGTAEWQIHGYEPAFHSLRSSPLARTFNTALRLAGSRPRFKLKTGTSDMNVVGPVWNCPIVAYGPGDSLLDHTPNEHVVLAEYLQSIQILQTVIASLHESISHNRQNNAGIKRLGDWPVKNPLIPQSLPQIRRTS